MGGAEKIVRMVASMAAASKAYDRVEVMVLSRDRSGTLDELLAYGNVELHYTNARSELSGVWKIARLLARHPFALVFSSSTHLNALSSLLRRLRILRAERVVARESTVIFDRSFGKRGAIIRCLYRFYGGHDMLVCQTERMKDSLEANIGGWLKPRPITIPNPVDMGGVAARQDTGGGGVELRIAWCGRLSDVKSPEIALRALALARDGLGAPVKLYMIGNGPRRAKLEALCHELGIAGAVDFTGHAKNPSEIMSRCHVGLMTSAIEGFPNVVLEMLASGIGRVISTDCAGGLREIPGVEVLESGDPAAFAEALLRKVTPSSQEEIREFISSRSPRRFFRLIAGMTAED